MITLPDDVVAVVVGDVAGHGIEAAGIMAQLRNALRAYLLETASPAEALSRLNTFTASLLPDAFATALVACVNTTTGTVSAASAGHLKPYLTDRVRPAMVVPVSTSPPLGLTGADYSASRFTIPSGAELVLFSDGLIERRTEDLSIGLERLAAGLTALGPHSTASEVAAGIATSGAQDDTTIVALHRN